MRRTIVRRTAVATSALSLALLVSACGSDEPAAKGSSKSKGGKTAAADSSSGGSAGKVLAQADLEKLALAEGDVKGYKIAKATDADVATGASLTTDKEECRPLVDIMGLRPTGKPGASAARKITFVPAKPSKDASAEEQADAVLAGLSATITAETLGSYEGKGAPDALAALAAAGKACAGGFTSTVGGEKTTVKAVTPATYSGGDEAVAFSVMIDLDGKPVATPLVAVRQGATVASFYSLAFAAEAEQPKALVEAQLATPGGMRRPYGRSGSGGQWCAPPCASRRLYDASISASASARPTQSAPSTDLPGSRSL